MTGIAGLLLGFFVGWVVAGTQSGVAPPSAQAADPHAGVPGAPPLTGAPPPEGGRTVATMNPELMEQARALERLLEQDPNNYLHLVHLGNIQFDLQNFVRAREFYERARAIRDDSPDVLSDLGVCYREADPRKALALFDKAAAMDPKHWRSRFNGYVVCLHDLHDLTCAQGYVEQIKKLEGVDKAMPNPSDLEQEIRAHGSAARP